MKKFLEIKGTDPRYELKMVAPDRSCPELMLALRLDRSGISPLYPPRRVQSIYLDTPTNKALQENQAGISARRKFRFRWYGAGSHAVRGQLECKVRQNGQGWKHLAPIPDLVDIAGQDRNHFMAFLRRHAPTEWSALLYDALAPVQWIAYRREYYTTADRTVRLTVDRDLRGWDQHGAIKLSNRFATPLPSVTVLELKCDAVYYETARDLANRLPLSVDKCSKFVLASSPANGLGAILF